MGTDWEAVKHLQKSHHEAQIVRELAWKEVTDARQRVADAKVALSEAGEAEEAAKLAGKRRGLLC